MLWSWLASSVAPFVAIVSWLIFYLVGFSSSSRWLIEQNDEEQSEDNRRRRQRKRQITQSATLGQASLLAVLSSFLFGTYLDENTRRDKMNDTSSIPVSNCDCRLHSNNNQHKEAESDGKHECCCAQDITNTTPKKGARSDISKYKLTVVDYLPSDNFSFIRCQREDGKTQNTQELNDQTQGGRRLLILFAWLFAKQRHLDKYRALYMAQGFDVLTVIVNVRDFLLPATGSHRIAAQIIGFLRQHQHEYGHYIFQAFSVGAYQVGELFVMLQKERNKELLAETKSRLKGLIYDSALDLDQAPVGLSRATTDNVLLQWGISTLMAAHLRLSYHISTRYYIKSSEAVKSNIMDVPVLVFMSKDDVVVNYEMQIKLIEKWQQTRKPDMVAYKCWDQSPHVSHFFKHPEEYSELVNTFVTKVLQV